MANNFATTLENVEKENTLVTTGFTGNVRALGATFLEEGDIFRIPTDFKVFRNPNIGSDENPVLFTVVELFDKNGSEVVTGKNLYPSMFNRTTYIWEKDEFDNLLNTHKYEVPKGLPENGNNPIKDFNAEKTIQDGIKAVAGKKIRVKGVKRINTRNFERNGLTAQSVYTLEYAE